MSNDLIQVLEVYFTRTDERTAALLAELDRSGRALGRVEHGVAQLTARIDKGRAERVTFSASLDRFEDGLARIEKRLGIETPPEPDPLAGR